MKDNDEKIKALLLKTVKNGATPAEEAGALVIANRLMKIRTPGQIKPVYSKQQELDFYSKCLDNGSVENNVTAIDWDKIAQVYLIPAKYHDYIILTETTWNLCYNITVKTRISIDEYRRVCYKSFHKLSG